MRALNWVERRAIVLHEADYECASCGGTATEADHKWPKKWGGTDDFENLQALCRSCNASKGDALRYEHMTPARLQATAAIHLDDAKAKVRLAARVCALSAVGPDEDLGAADETYLEIAAIPEPIRRFMAEQVMGALFISLDDPAGVSA